MSITIEQALKILDEIDSKKESIENICNTDDFMNIYREAIIKYKDLEGRLVWDYDPVFYNELTFIENRTGKHYSLGKVHSDDPISNVFDYLAKKYEKDNHKLVCEIAIIYESRKAVEAAEKLYKYICLKKEMNTIVLSVKEYEYLKKNNQLKADKEIILGHHSMADKMIMRVGKHIVGSGMSVGYNEHICVLMAKRSDYPSGELGKLRFGLYYQREMGKFEHSAKELDISRDFDENKRTTVSMYNFLLVYFVENKYLDGFIDVEYTDTSREMLDELCEELKRNPICKKYITSDILKKIIKEKKFLADMGKRKSLWRDLCQSDDGEWRIQRYWIKDYCRICFYEEREEVRGTVEQIICPILEHCRREELKEKIPQRDWGIVFCGGGGKGAYQIGVCKWLKEHGIADKITGVSGASVGALNSLLFVEGNYELAETVWNSVTPKIIMKQNGFPFWQDQDDLGKLLETYMREMRNVCTSEKLVYSALTCVNGIPLKAILGYLQEGVAPTNSSSKAEYFCWASRKQEEIKEIVLASAAIPGIKQPRKFEGKTFVDGGLEDNVPVRPLVEDGFRNIIVVHLGDNEKIFQKAVAGIEDITKVNFHHVRRIIGRIQRFQI